MEESAKKFEEKMVTAYNDISQTHLRPLMKKSFQCSSNCCDMTEGRYEVVQRCIQDCATSSTEAHNYLKNEFEDFQKRVQRCFMVCQDSTNAKMEKDKASFSKVYEKDYEVCASKCLDTHSEQLASVVQRIKSTLDSHANAALH